MDSFQAAFFITVFYCVQVICALAIDLTDGKCYFTYINLAGVLSEIFVREFLPRSLSFRIVSYRAVLRSRRSAFAITFPPFRPADGAGRSVLLYTITH